ncbi:MAG: hypothetical protein ACJATP_000096 [Candidatus Azotimanducaceae bacterium]|jgi:hypothetical protein
MHALGVASMTGLIAGVIDPDGAADGEKMQLRPMPGQ